MTALLIVKLGETRKQARRAYRHHTTRGKKYQDFFCLTPRGVRVWYASPKLVKTLKGKQKHVLGRVVWASTSNPYYSIAGIRTGATLHAAETAIRHGHLFHVGLNFWYVAAHGKVSAILKVRNQVVQEVGIADRQITRTSRQQHTLLTSFPD